MENLLAYHFFLLFFLPIFAYQVLVVLGLLQNLIVLNFSNNISILMKKKKKKLGGVLIPFLDHFQIPFLDEEKHFVARKFQI